MIKNINELINAVYLNDNSDAYMPYYYNELITVLQDYNIPQSQIKDLLLKYLTAINDKIIFPKETQNSNTDSDMYNTFWKFAKMENDYLFITSLFDAYHTGMINKYFYNPVIYFKPEIDNEIVTNPVNTISNSIKTLIKTPETIIHAITDTTKEILQTPSNFIDSITNLFKNAGTPILLIIVVIALVFFYPQLKGLFKK